MMIIGIVGLGLMGGSLGLSLKKSMKNLKIVGYDKNIEHSTEALSLGLIDENVTFEELKQCDIIVLAIPVEAIISILKELKDVSEDTTIIDLGSTKEKIINNIPKEIRSNLVPAHPMAGIEKFGPTAAFGELYQDKIVVICRSDFTSLKHIQMAVNIFEALNMKIVYMDAKEHDKHAAYISHLPHAISYALANSVLKQEDPKNVLALAAGGFRDMSRIAKSSPAMWSDIFKQNRENLLTSIESFEAELSFAKELLKQQKYSELKERMQSATTLHKIF
jgi:prephenate dehydrogenase